MTGLWLVSYIVLWILFLVVAVVLLMILRNPGMLFNSVAMPMEAFEIPTKITPGEALPELTIETLSGDRVSISTFHGAKTAFLILNPQCPLCVDLLKKVAENSADPDLVQLMDRRQVIVSLGNLSETTKLIDQVGLNKDIPVLVDVESNVATEWGVKGSMPIRIVVDEQLNVVRIADLL